MTTSKIFLGVSASVLAVAAFAASKAKIKANTFYTNVVTGCNKQSFFLTVSPQGSTRAHIYTVSTCTGSLPKLATEQ